MRSDVRDKLRAFLGDDLTLVEALPDEELARLCTALEAARRGQARALAAASEEAVRQMPAPLRGTIGKILGR
jgi:hypothetical protein